MDFYDTQIPAKIDAPPEKPVDVALTPDGRFKAWVCLGCMLVMGTLAVWAMCQ